MMLTSSPGALSLLAKAHILIVEDSALMRDLLYTCLKAFNVPKVSTVETPEQCLKELKNHPLDALLIDWRLKDENGLDLVREIRREMPDPICRIPIVLCTGYSELPQVIEARDSGINEMLCKPVTPKALYSKLSAALTCDRKFVATETYIGPERRPLRHDFVSDTAKAACRIEDVFI